MTPPAETRIIRAQTSILLTGVVFVLVGIAFVTATLLTQGAKSHEGDTFKIQVLVSFLPILYGTLFSLRWLNGYLTLDSDGITLRGPMGGCVFRASWSDVKRLEQRVGTGNAVLGKRRSYFALHTARQIVFLRDFGLNDEMAAIIRRSASLPS